MKSLKEMATSYGPWIAGIAVAAALLCPVTKDTVLLGTPAPTPTYTVTPQISPIGTPTPESTIVYTQSP